MLVLSRRTLETLRIGENITITVLGIKGGQVRLGIAAPVEMAIRRESAGRRIKVEAPPPDDQTTLAHEEK